MEISTATGYTGGEPAGTENENNQRLPGQLQEVEKGTGYGEPGEGSGETVPRDELTNDGDPLGGSDDTDPELLNSDQIDDDE